MTQAVVQVRNIVARSGFANPLTLEVLVTDEDYLKVYADTTLLDNGPDYAITGIGDPNGISIEIIGAEDVGNYVGVITFTALYDPPLDQQGSLAAGGVLGRAFESALDQQNRRLQAQGDRIDRALKVNVTIDGDIILNPENGKVPYWNGATQTFLWTETPASSEASAAAAAASAAAAAVNASAAGTSAAAATVAKTAAEMAETNAEAAQAAAEAAAAAAANKLPLAGGTMTGPIGFTHQASPANPSAGVLALFAKNDNKMYTRTPAGVEVALGSGSIVDAASRAAIKAIDTTLYAKAAFDGSIWEFVSGNFTARVAADTQEGVFVKATAISAATGCWVRQGNWFSDGLDARWFGIVADGTTNDTAAMVCAFAVAQLLAVALLLPPGVIMCDPAALIIGDGSNAAPSTTNGFRLSGAGGTPYFDGGTVIKARGAGTVMLSIRGTISGLVLEDFTIDCDGVAQYGVFAYSMNASTVKNVAIRDFTTYGWLNTVRTMSAGVSWSTQNLFQNLFMTSGVVVGFGAGLYLGGVNPGGGNLIADTHHCTFINVTVEINKHATDNTRALHLGMTDSNTFIECDFTLSGSGTGTPVLFDGSTDANGTVYPLNNFFYGCSLQDAAISVSGTIGNNTFMNFVTKDGELVPTDTHLKGITDDGVFFGNWGVSVEAVTLNFTFATPGDLAKTFSSQQAVLIKAGKTRKLMFNLVTSAFTHTTASGSLRITGLPETVSNAWGTMFIGNLQFAGITKATYTQFTIRAEPGQTYCAVLASGSGVAGSAVVAADMPTGGSVVLRGQVEYLVD